MSRPKPVLQIYEHDQHVNINTNQIKPENNYPQFFDKINAPQNIYLFILIQTYIHIIKIVIT